MKLCKDCKHCVPATYPWSAAENLQFARCARTQEPPKLDFVGSGVTRPPRYQYYCSTWRAEGDCGPDAKQFEPLSLEVAEPETKARPWWKFWSAA